ncbi:vgr related protein [Sphingorhabdus sp. Alg239-R122]|uniref:vgr related protein n=1 Tax=Sphingorhabdus sp. Alg239-R122 TaxID=2305989 RepID=UPI0013D99568|nr:vgr related protein [Sphingorhabdus sp. Alg239-R122]
MTSRLLTQREKALVASVFGDAIALEHVEICNHKWFPFQPVRTVMAPRGHIHFHPRGDLFKPDYAQESLGLQGLFIHEMVHVWQHQKGIFLPLKRHPFCRYHYTLKPGWRLERYGIEQQAEIVRHAFLLREGALIAGAPPLEQYLGILPFSGFKA